MIVIKQEATKAITKTSVASDRNIASESVCCPHYLLARTQVHILDRLERPLRNAQRQAHLGGGPFSLLIYFICRVRLQTICRDKCVIALLFLWSDAAVTMKIYFALSWFLFYCSLACKSTSQYIFQICYTVVLIIISFFCRPSCVWSLRILQRHRSVSLCYRSLGLMALY